MDPAPEQELMCTELIMDGRIQEDNLKRMGLVLQQPYGPIELTQEGLKLAYDVQKRHVLLRSFLEKLGVSTQNADRDACLMEHILSAETLDRIRSYMAAD